MAGKDNQGNQNSNSLAKIDMVLDDEFDDYEYEELEDVNDAAVNGTSDDISEEDADKIHDDDFADYNEKEFVAKSDRRYIVLVIYDIVNNKKRNRMVKCLESYGIRVQKSAFEAYLTKKKYEQLMQDACKIIDKDVDSLRIYLLANNTSVRAWGLGDTHIDDVIII